MVKIRKVKMSSLVGATVYRFYSGNVNGSVNAKAEKW
jgi:hypothetical protein